MGIAGAMVAVACIKSGVGLFEPPWLLSIGAVIVAYTGGRLGK